MIDQARRTVAEMPAEEFVEMLAKAVGCEVRAAVADLKPVTLTANYSNSSETLGNMIERIKGLRERVSTMKAPD